MLRAASHRMLLHEPGTRLGADPEDLHRMRVTVRRMRSLLRMHGPHLPGAIRSLGDDLRWLGGVLGPVRDLDVQLEQLASWRASRPPAERNLLRPLEALLLERRVQARSAMLAELDSRRYVRLVRRLKRRLRAGPGGKPLRGRTPIRKVAPDLVRKRRRALMRAGRAIRPGSAPADYHRVRILAKRFRYCLEFHGPLWGEPARRVIAKLKKLQDVLGAHQDAEVSLDRLRRLLQDPEEFPPRTVEAIAEWADHREREARLLRREFQSAFRGLQGSRWKRLRRRMDGRD
jgi:CHAD domain-containing protein